MKPFLVTSSAEPSVRSVELSVDSLTKAAEIRLRLHHRLSSHFLKAEIGGAGTAAGGIDGGTKRRPSSRSTGPSLILIGTTGFRKTETGGAGITGATTGRENSGKRDLPRP
jgi:hypothetical protein